MAKIVKKTYGKKLAWGTGSCPAFDEAKVQSKKSSAVKVLRPSIWAKVPLIETFAESPPRSKKKSITAPTVLAFPETVSEQAPKKKGRKRKIEDPFGFGDLDEEVAPASEYISPKKKKQEHLASSVKKNGVKMKVKKSNVNKSGSSVFSGMDTKSPNLGLKCSTKEQKAKKSQSLSENGASPKKRGRPPKGQSPGTLSPKSISRTNDKVGNKSPGLADIDVSPRKRGRPPKDKSLISLSPKFTSDIKQNKTLKSLALYECDASPKKRGRPPKDKSLLSTSPKTTFGVKGNSIKKSPALSEGDASPKKRGRPPKDKSLLSTSPKTTFDVKGNNIKKSPPLSEGDASPKKRGRPPKDQSLKTISPKITSTVKGNKIKKSPAFMENNLSPKKLGRPQKTKTLSPGSQNASGKSSEDIMIKSPVLSKNATSPKKYGRPPRDKSLAVSSPKITTSSKKGLLPDSPISSEGASTPKKRGRPPKNKIESPVTNAVPMAASTLPRDAGNENKSPKLLGRPKKSTNNETKTSNVKSSPKKQPKSPAAKELFRQSPLELESETDTGNLSVTAQNVIDVIDGAPLVKRKRGRPAKQKITENSKDHLVSNSHVDPDQIKISEGVGESSLVSQVFSETDTLEINEDEVHNQFISPTEAEMLAEQTTQEMTPKKVRFSSENESDLSGRASSSTETGSPFKWFLKNNKKTLSPRKVAKLRRISVLPTCSTEGDDDEEDMDAAVPFGLPWGLEPDENSLRVTKDEKELFTIVRNTKQAQESVEFGESQQFKDDVEYLLDGIADTNSLSTRCLSLIELASKCAKTAFRMNLRAHGTIAAIFEKLSDAPNNQRLALCTAALMFMLTRDRLSIDFDKSILEMMLKLLAMKEDAEEESSKDWTRLTTKIKDIFGKDSIKGVNNLDLSKLTTESLARESFLSLTLQRTGSWFKDEIRLLGGLDHVVDTVVSCSKCLKANGKSSESDSVTSVRQIERCLKLLENVTVQCTANQGYLVSYRDSALLESCARLIKFSVTSLFESEQESANAVQALWFSTMKMLLNLTHDNELASTRFCQKNDVLGLLLKTALQCPKHLPVPKQFDVAVLSLGLIINLVEYSKKNLAALNAVVAPAFHRKTPEKQDTQSQTEEASAVDSLLHLFLVKLEAAKENSGMEEDLSKLNNSLHSSNIRIGSDGLSLVCGDDLDKTQTENSVTEEPTEEGNVEEKPSTAESEAEKEAEHIGRALQKAGQHMEDSLIASYAALLLGLLAEDSKENQQTIYEHLQYGDFGVMTHTLDKFLAFMNMTANTSNSSSSLIIKRAISTLEKCKAEYPPKLPVS